MFTPPEKLARALSDRYRIERKLGEGGMATVYLADDLKHERKVALKVLKPELAAVVGAERFLVEIKTTANLQHPHILPLFDSGEADGFLFYVMPYVDGETLLAKLEREKQLPVEEAVRIARGVASALEYAHEQDVVHRDIKPANILLNRGEPLVADFGIALALSEAGGGRITETGLSLGTPHYMSPEQAAGARVDARSDVYALGCVLFELLTGEPPHAGANTQVVLSKILTDEARRVTEVRRKVPPNVDAAVARALEKLPADRITSASDFIGALDDTTFRHGPEHAAGSPSGAGPRAWKFATFALAVIATILAASLGVARSNASRTPSVFKARIALPEAQGLVLPQTGSALALSPDGGQLSYAGPSLIAPWQFWLRSGDALEATLLRTTNAAFTPAFSPDGSSLATVRPDLHLNIEDLLNGSSRSVADDALGIMDWTREGNLYYFAEDAQRTRSEMWKVSASGGAATKVPLPDRAASESRLGFSEQLVYTGDVMPGERGMLVTQFPPNAGTGSGAFVLAVDLEHGTTRELVRGFHPTYVDSGYLLWGTPEGVLMAASFDSDAMSFTGDPQKVAEDILVDPSGIMHYAVSNTGSLVYRSRGADVGGTGLMWVERDGTQTRASDLVIGLTLGLWDAVDLSPDDQFAAVSSEDAAGAHILTQSLTTDSPPNRITFQGSHNVRPRWARAGSELVFVSDIGGAGRTELWSKPADGTGTARRLLAADVEIEEGFLSPDGEWLVYRTGGTTANRDIMAIRPGIDTGGRAIAATSASERAARLSPDGHFLAYTSDEGGRDDVFVVTFPDPSGGKWQVSRDGGQWPLWAHNGTELFYRDPSSQMMAVSFSTANNAFRPLETRELFSTGNVLAGSNTTGYAISSDDQRFLMISVRDFGQGDLVWVQNWTQELRDGAGRQP